METVVIIVVIILVLVLYLLPAIVAFARKHHNAVPILILNVFLGWFFGLGWVAALIWAFTRTPSINVQIVNSEGKLSERRFCSNCGVGLRAGTQFCAQCGAKRSD